MQMGGIEDSADDKAVGGSYLEQPNLMQQIDVRFLLELAPQLIRPKQQRHIIGMLKIRLPDHARFAVRAAAVVSAGELIDPQDVCTAPGELISRRASHAAGTEDDRVVVAHGLN